MQQKSIPNQIADSYKTTQATVHTISSHMADFETGPKSEHEDDQEQQDMDLLVSMESDNEWLNSPPEVYSVTISKFPTTVDFPIEIRGLFKTEAQVSCVSYDCYREFKVKNRYKHQSFG